MKRKVLCGLLVGALAATLLAGCGNDSAAEDKASVTDGMQAETEGTSDTEDDLTEAEEAQGSEAEADVQHAQDEEDTVDAQGETKAGEDADQEEPAAANPAVTTVLPVSDAAFTGVEVEGEMKEVRLDEAYGVAADLFPGALVTWTVPEGVEGTFDLYLTISRSSYPYGETPFDVRVNGALQVWPMQMLGATEEIGKDDDLGTFLGAKDVTLAGGDEISVSGKYGLSFGTMASLIPDLGDLLMVPAGEEVAVGYTGTRAVPEEEETDASDPISGKTILWLGSSVTYGQAAEGYSMADAIDDAHANVTTLKYAISGTTLVVVPEKGSQSYVERLEELQTSIDPDLVVVQLSTNDATQGKPLGELSEETAAGSFDTATIVGAEEEICAYVKETWGCPVVWYTGSYYESDTSENYQAMVDALLPVAEKWDCAIVDLWNDEEMKAIYDSDQYHAWMNDGIHPNRDGYIEWWAPQFEPVLAEAFQ